MRVLIIEDHEDMAANIGDYLEAQGHTTDFALDGLVGLHLAVTNEYDVIVLDLGLPGMDGLTLCRKLREEARSDTPVLMLTARDSLPDKLEGFESGADDYLVKPFALQELDARLRALTTRGRHSTPQLLRVADLELDPETFVVRRGGRRLELNRTCIRILEMLMSASPKVVRRAAIEHEIWGDDPPDSDALRSHIYSLRRTIDRPFDRPLLHTVHGVGFRLAAAEDE
jgi:DNA-binding response OmpR family regulator